MRGFLNIIEMLLDRCDIDIIGKTNRCESASCLNAAKNGFTAITLLLLEKGLTLTLILINMLLMKMKKMMKII